MKKQVPTFVLILAAVAALIVVGLFGYKVMNPQQEETINPADVRRHMEAAMPHNGPGQPANPRMSSTQQSQNYSAMMMQRRPPVQPIPPAAPPAP